MIAMVTSSLGFNDVTSRCRSMRLYSTFYKLMGFCWTEKKNFLTWGNVLKCFSVVVLVIVFFLCCLYADEVVLDVFHVDWL